MKAYYFDSGYCESTLYLPGNLIVVENEEENWFDVKYKPEEIIEFDKLWNNDRESLLSNPKSILEVEIDKGLLKQFQDSCFSNNESSMLVNALKIFQLTKKEVEESYVD